MVSRYIGFRFAVTSALVLLTSTLAWVLAVASDNVQVFI
jgi:hypothetical protein